MIKDALKCLAALRSYPYVKELAAGIHRKWFPVFITYPVDPKPRFLPETTGPHRELHSLIAANDGLYREHLAAFRDLSESFFKIQNHEPETGTEPSWGNAWFSGLDAIALYGFVATAKPPTYLEIGSGNSTKFARRAIRDHSPGTRIISIDPHPRAEIDSLSDQVVRTPLEAADLSIFDSLGAGDVVFFDGSHRSFMNSDVTVFFMEVMPKLPPGILIHIHDIHLPYDYPPERALHYESEQYLLAAMMLGGCTRYETVFPVRYLLHEKPLLAELDVLWKSDRVKIPHRGTSFWMRKLA